MEKCSNCGTDLGADDVFCFNCGRPASGKQAGEHKLEAEECSVAEKILLPVALLLAILFDRLIVAYWLKIWLPESGVLYGVFFLCYLVAFYSFNWKRLALARNRAAWFLAAGAAALCVWYFFFLEQNREFYVLTSLVIPGVLMVHAQWATGAYTLNNTESVATAWFKGWLVYPLSGWHALSKSLGSLFSKASKPMVKRAMTGVVVASLLLIVIVPLLMGADSVFSYFLRRMVADFNFGSLIGHTVVVIIMFCLLYSFLWNIGFFREKPYRIPEPWSIDVIISAIVLGSIISVYLLFCLVQFTYLFAGAGLPDSMTYSEYAREGFAQTVAVCTINLLLFGVFRRFGGPRALLAALLSGLLGLTVIMLISGAVRLNLYIGAYGMTWLRLLSAWFIIYLAAVILLCGTDLLRKKRLPIAAISFLMLLGWYVALGYLNPDGFVEWYNSSVLSAVP